MQLSTTANPNTITKLRVQLDSDNDLALEFETPSGKYFLAVVLGNNQSLEWKEVQAIVSCLKIAATGTSITDHGFQLTVLSLALASQRVMGPQRMLTGRLSATVIPPRGTFEIKSLDMLVRTGLLYSRQENSFYFVSGTQRNVMFKVKLELSSDEPGLLSPGACSVFLNVLNILEPGDNVPEVAFLAYMEKINQETNLVMNIQRTIERGVKIIFVKFSERRAITTDTLLTALSDAFQSALQDASRS